MMISPATSTDWDDTGDTPANSYTVQLFGGFVKYREPIFEAGVLQLYIYIFFKSQYR